MRSSGTLYYNSQGISNIAINGSGRWELKDDGALCAKFNTAPPSRVTDARSPENGCWYFFRDGEKRPWSEWNLDAIAEWLAQQERQA